MTWNRERDGFVDVIDLQTRKSGDALTLNVGVLHRDIYETCWGKEAPHFANETCCIVRARIGELIDGKDVWWSAAEQGTAAEVAEVLRTHALPFLEKMHSLGAMEEFLVRTQVVQRKNPPPIIYLAILEYERGDRQEACTLLRELQESTIGAWKSGVGEIRAKLGCS